MKMLDNSKVFCKNYISKQLQISPFLVDAQDANYITELVIDDVVEDIEETADENFTASDIDIAFVRVLKKRLEF